MRSTSALILSCVLVTGRLTPALGATGDGPKAAYLVDMMLAKRPDVRTAMIQSGARMCILAYDEYTTDLPEFDRMATEKVDEFPNLSAKDFWDARARGLGGSETDPLCCVAEENVLGCPGDPYKAECILIHEFAHNIHLGGLVNADPTFDRRLKATYAAAMNHYEYYAEGVQSWFDDNRVNDQDHNHVHLRSQLIEYDPGLAALCREVFDDMELKYYASPTNATQRYLYRARLDGAGTPERWSPPDQPGSHRYVFSPDSRWAFHTWSTFDQPPVTELAQLPEPRSVRVLDDWGSGQVLFHRAAAELGKRFDYFVYPNRDHGLSEGKGSLVHVRMSIARHLIDHLSPGRR